MTGVNEAALDAQRCGTSLSRKAWHEPGFSGSAYPRHFDQKERRKHDSFLCQKYSPKRR